MAKRLSTRELQRPPAVRIHKRAERIDTNDEIKNLLAAAGRVRQPGSIAFYSGVAQAHPSARGLRADLSLLPLPGWIWRRWTIDAPPAGGQVLWLRLELASQWWKFHSNIGATNNSSHYKYADFGINWHWMLLPDQFDVPGAPACMQDGGTYEFYASKPPGDNTWTAWWVHPSRGVTLTPDDKDSDPNSLALLLRSENNGRLGLMYAAQFPGDRILFNGQEAAGFVIDGGPRADSLYFSMAVALPRSIVTVGNIPTDGLESAARSGPRRPARTRRKRKA